MSGSAVDGVKEKTGPEGAAAGSRRLYWNRTEERTGGSDSVETMGREAQGGEVEAVDVGGGVVVTESGAVEESSENRKDKETEGEEDTVEAGEA